MEGFWASRKVIHEEGNILGGEGTEPEGQMNQGRVGRQQVGVASSRKGHESLRRMDRTGKTTIVGMGGGTEPWGE